MPTPVTERVADTVARALTWRIGKGTMPVPPEQRLPIFLTAIGALCMPLGLIFVILGWYGAAHTPYDFEQVPYLISGGLLGIGLCLMGGFFFFGAWIARVSQNTQRTADQIALLAERLAGGAVAGNGTNGANGDATASRSRAEATSNELVATATGSMLHRADCPIVSSRDNVRSVPKSEQDKLKPCQICQPLSVG